MSEHQLHDIGMVAADCANSLLKAQFIDMQDGNDPSFDWVGAAIRRAYEAAVKDATPV